jgi:pimeloyl-ACP methyl ester carboxylesterase
VRTLTAGEKTITAAFAAKDYEAAAKACREVINLAPEAPTGYYNLACALARLGKPEAAMEQLKRAVEQQGFSDSDQLAADEDLASLRHLPEFVRLAGVARRNRWLAYARLPVEKGRELAEVKTVEANPEDGLRYRVRMSPAATAAKPNRLIVWLHPSGGSMNETVEALAPALVRKGFALLVLTQKQYCGWTADEMQQLMKVTVPHAGTIVGIAAQRPILMGFSAGGQAALNVFAAEPATVGGLVLSAAYPLALDPSAPRRYQTLAVPRDAAARQAPIFALVGENDRNAKYWTTAAPTWRQAGIDLTLITVPGKGHDWLVDPAREALLLTWLERLTGDSRPPAPAPAPP